MSEDNQKGLNETDEQYEARKQKEWDNRNAKNQSKAKSQKKASDKTAIEALIKLSEEMTQRFDDIENFSRDHVPVHKVKNANFFDHRNKTPVSDKLKVDKSNIFSNPTIDNLEEMVWQSESNGLASAEALAKISAKIQGLGYPREDMAQLFWDLSRYCANTSSSAQMKPEGVFEHSNGTVSKAAVLAVIKDQSTLRKVCRSYAPIVWNHMLITNSPPSDWQARGFTESTKYAAFDFFDFILNPAAVQPLEGLIRTPTDDETIAHATYKRIALDKHARNKRFANYSSEITGGKFGPDLTRKWRDDKR
ncbi:coat protein [Sweet potato C6 virus]|uniref:Capsid protein n=1 Tax=Sweet potato C6 virus TaxID=1307958 RepID=J7GKV6_9VIRU|nr:coat protein [Sweet potato C6 virus]AFP73392.1 coat protein [Sweet potato C6 virus]AGH32544.1 coat protein [Sweet potato C6 virus]